MNQDLLVTIFVPVYNGEKYLTETLNSIKNQTYKNIEVLLVDDSSLDGSRTILFNFANNDKRFKVFEKENGGMAPRSWNFIIPKIKGNFIFYSSQDDIFSINLIEKMIERQLKTDADTVIPDMEYYFENGQNNKKIIGLNNNRFDILSGMQACAESLNWNIHGFALFKSNLVKEEFFPEDAFDSDEFITRKLFLKSNKVVFSEGVFYYRQDNSNAITKIFTINNFYTLNTIYRLYDLLKRNDFAAKFIFETQLLLLETYLQLNVTAKIFKFKNKIEENEIQLFLSDFGQKKLSIALCFSNFSYAIRSCNVKYFLFIISCKVPILLALVTMIKSKKYF